MSRIAFVVASGYEDSELEVPLRALREQGHACSVVGPEAGRTLEGKRGGKVRVDVAVADANPHDYDLLVVPGGHSPDRLRTDEEAVAFVRGFFDMDKPVAAICHAGHLLIEAEVVWGRTLTSWRSVRKDLENAGAVWVDRPVVEDGNLITSRRPEDLPEFVRAISARLAAPASA